MAQAQAINAVTSRRSFLAKTAAGSAVLALGTASPLLAEASQRVPDPILEAIETHRAYGPILEKVLSLQSALERELPRDRRESTIDSWGENIVETDDPRWIKCQREVNQTFDAETDAACELVSIQPTMMAGVIALLHYAAADADGEAWPRKLVSDDGKRTRSWHHFLVENLAETLTDLQSVGRL